MAEQAKMRSADHNVVHCLKCNKPQTSISVHLTRVCMKRYTPEERATELQKMKSSSRKWGRQSRTWDYKFLCKIVPHKPSRLALLKEFLELGFLVNNQPHEADLDLGDAPASTSATATASTSEAAAASSSATAASSSGPDSRNQSSPSSSDRDGGPSDPTWQKNPPAVTRNVRVKMRAAGLYNKFSDDTELIVDFKKFLFEDLNVPNCQQEVDNVSRFLRYMQPTGDVPTLDFLKKSTKTRDFVQGLKHTDVTASTVRSYIKSILRFVDYLTTRLDLDHTKYEQFGEGTRSVREYQEVLRVARADFLHTFWRYSPERDGQTDQTSPPRDVLSSVKHFDEFITSFPVTNDGKPPTKRQRIDAGFPDNRVFYDKWRGDQYAKRRQYLLSQFKSRKPSARRVSRLIEKEGWKANHPTAEDILQMWEPASGEEIEGDKQVLKSVATQKWKGVSIKHFGGEKGLGVVATRPFSKGDIVCDYHGEVITADEGNKKMESLKNQPGYMFFFKSGDRALCIDAHTHPCKCHANLETVGRRINHSCKKPNLKPLQCVLKVDGEDTYVILFQTLKDIKVDKELRFDYGVQEWLDE